MKSPPPPGAGGIDAPALNGLSVGERTELLRSWALEAGFDRVGVATLEPLDEDGALLAWLDRGDHADMTWMERATEVRREPERLFPGARSALCVALQYGPRPAGEAAGEGGEPASDLWPRVARYARGRDYHNVMGKRLKRLARRIREAFPGTDTRAYVDTGPVLERPLAARAGLGSVGKHTLLLDADAGSWFLLGEVFTSLELQPTRRGVGEGAGAAPPADLCGRCTACLAACPTGALPEPYRLVADRCISYWTIEHRGAFPEEIRREVGDWVFGCDLCQEACPYNLRLDRWPDGRPGRPAPTSPSPDKAFDLPPERGEVDLAGLLAMEQEELDRLFHGSPMRRAQLVGLKRNAATAMGNRGDAAYVPALVRALADSEDDVRRHAAWALGEIARKESALASASGPVAASETIRAALEEARASEGSLEVREEIAAALARAAHRDDPSTNG